jgi:tetratricopeptide (TPR) repeat protein
VENLSVSTAPAPAKPAGPSDSQAVTTPAAALFAAPEKRTFVLSLLLVVVTLAVYNQATHFSFVNFDDDRYVTDNPHVLAGLSWNTMKWAITTTDVANWHPLAWISHALDCQLFRVNPAGHHLTSVVLHALTAVLLFLFLWRATRRLAQSFFVAAVFALHPWNVESVVWISERKNILSTMFFLLTLLAYTWYAQKPGWKRYVAVVGLFVCALASKPMVITLPFVLLLLDYWPLRRIQGWTESGDTVAQISPAKLVVEKVPLLILTIGSSFVTMYAQRIAGAIGVLPFPLSVRLKNALYCYLLYVGKTVWPAKLAALYPHPGHSMSMWKAMLGGMFVVVISALVVKFRSRGYLVTGWFWFVGTLVPVIGIVQVGNQAMADRYAYVPTIGLFVMIAWGVAELLNHAKAPLWLKIAPAACSVLALTVVTYIQAGYWRDSLHLWDHALQVTNNNFVAEDEFGGALVDLGRDDEAYPHFIRAAKIAPSDPVCHSNIGAYLHRTGHPAEALPQYLMAAHLTTDARVLATTYANIGVAYADTGDFSKAHAAFDRSIRLKPDRFNTWAGVGMLAEREGKPQEAIRCFARSIELKPSDQAYFELGRMLAQTGRTTEAIAAYEFALKISPDLAGAQQALEALRQPSNSLNSR